MLGNSVSQILIISQTQMLAQVLAQSNLDQARQHKTAQNLELALASYDQAKVNFKYIADARQIVPSLSEAKSALNQAHMPQTPEEEALRQRIAQVYFERGELLKELGKLDKAQASYKKAQDWGHEPIEPAFIVLTEPEAPTLAQTVPSVSMSIQEQSELVDYLFESIVGGQADARRSEETSG